ncbi:PocR ligand-binding domain-containing protein [Pelosinus sp. sgz500959]|uniref:PocR ligand-binding domain-containing protein n=1 Tax=Pelosinus sp. sgz500959 TaxID=3242472 RepID=UPI00366AF453
MKLSNNITLTDIIDINTLYNLQEKLGKLVDIPQITTDVNGVPVGKASNFISFCRLIRSSPKGLQQCIECDRQAGLLAMEERQRRIYQCHTGLIDCAAPIIVNDYFIGSVLGGQVLIKGESTIDSIDVEKLSEKFHISREALQVAVEFIPLVSREHLENTVECYSFLANYIAQMGINRLIQEQLLQKSKEKHLLEQTAKKMELKTIQAQINPHFLFNTLNSIARMAVIEDAPQTEELIYHLSDLLRYSLKSIEDFPKIRADIGNIERYLFIQSLRFSDRISYELNIDEALMDYRIPSMIIQPIVENCMVHGLETKPEGGTIRIDGYFVSKKELEIKVTDNGKGIKPDVLKAIQQMGETSNPNIGIGTLNTYNRLKSCFGDRFALTIESSLDIGTCVTIRIPRIKHFSQEGGKLLCIN